MLKKILFTLIVLVVRISNVRNLETIRDGVEQQLKDKLDQVEKKSGGITDGIRGLLNR